MTDEKPSEQALRDLLAKLRLHDAFRVHVDVLSAMVAADRALAAPPAAAPQCAIRRVGGWNGHTFTSTWTCEHCKYKGDHDGHPGCMRRKIQPAAPKADGALPEPVAWLYGTYGEKTPCYTAAQLLAVRAQAVQEEREACALAALGVYVMFEDTAIGDSYLQDAARAIRARSTP